MPNLAVVTGAASGIGAATTARLLQDGLDVVAIDLNDPPARLDRDRRRLAWIDSSVADKQTWDRALAEAQRAFGRLPTILVSNAARFGSGTALTTDVDEWRRIIDVNLFGAVLGVRACLPGMIAQSDGRIVAVASVDAYMAEQDLVAYCTSKGALLQLIRCVSVDFARDGVRANVVCPGTVATETFNRIHAEAPNGDELLAMRRARNPLGRILAPEEIATTIAFLVSDASSGMTGSVLTVDAGLSVSFDFRSKEHSTFS
jgi:NAD(P)-dependent dehydrogenase (short-subunit alcohol dehydrogenase family)